MTDYPKMTADDVVDLVQLFDRHQIDIHIDGGWGVDALLADKPELMQI
jgi:glutamate/tyrosine decarboxylase-like PLP-dependent enzyme